MSTTDLAPDAPEGYERLARHQGFLAAFGPVWQHRDAPRLAFRVAENHLNALGACHGGALATFADLQGLVVRRQMRRDPGPSPTIHLDIDFLSPARLGDWVEAEILLARTTSTMFFTQALIRARGELIARSAAIYRHFGKEAS